MGGSTDGTMMNLGVDPGLTWCRCRADSGLILGPRLDRLGPRSRTLVLNRHFACVQILDPFASSTQPWICLSGHKPVAANKQTEMFVFVANAHFLKKDDGFSNTERHVQFVDNFSFAK